MRIENGMYVMCYIGSRLVRQGVVVEQSNPNTFALDTCREFCWAREGQPHSSHRNSVVDTLE
jgi:hypothetical protein